MCSNNSSDSTTISHLYLHHRDPTSVSNVKRSPREHVLRECSGRTAHQEVVPGE